MTEDVLVIGSGAGGVQTASALLERGLTVRMLDYGNEDPGYGALVPPVPFTELRRSDPAQHRYLLGEAFEGISLGALRAGAQLTPARLHIHADSARVLPTDASGFSFLESLAVGGLATGWGAAVCPFDDLDLEGFPLTRAQLAPHYERVAERIGVSGARDDLLASYGDSSWLLPPLELDSGAESLLARYAKKRRTVNARGLLLGRARLAVCSTQHRGRGPYRYLDTDYYADVDRSVYRPRWTLEELRRSPRFHYLGRRLAHSFVDSPSGTVRVRARIVGSDEEEVHEARALILAAGPLGTARIALRSLGRYDVPAPLLSNPYTYAVALNGNLLGRAPRDRRYSLTQLFGLFRPSEPGLRSVHVQLYSYRSLLTFKLLPHLPLPMRESLKLLTKVIPYLMLLGMNHEDRPAPSKYCVLRRGEPGREDRLELHYKETAEEEGQRDREEALFLAGMRSLRCLTLRTVRSGPGMSLHYGGMLPMSESGDELTCTPDCLLVGTRAVYVVDAACFPRLPSKGLTFTMMANADRVGSHVAGVLS